MKKRATLAILIASTFLLQGCKESYDFSPVDAAASIQESIVETSESTTLERTTEAYTEPETTQFSLSDLQITPRETRIGETSVSETTVQETTVGVEETKYQPTTTTVQTVESTVSVTAPANPPNPYTINGFTLSEAEGTSWSYEARVADLKLEYQDNSPASTVVFTNKGAAFTKGGVPSVDITTDVYNGYIHQILGNWYATRFGRSSEAVYSSEDPILVEAYVTDKREQNQVLSASYFLKYGVNDLVKVIVTFDNSMTGTVKINIIL